MKCLMKVLLRIRFFPARNTSLLVYHYAWDIKSVEKIIGKIATLTVRSFISCIEASVECIGKWCWVRKPKRSRLCRSTHKPRGRYWFFSLHSISLSSSWTAPLCQRKLFERSMAALTEKATEEVKNTNHFQIRNGKQIVDIDSLYQSYGTI